MEDIKNRVKFLKISPKLANFVAFFVVFCAVYYLFNPTAAQAANLYLSPSSGAYDAGKTFSVTAQVGSVDQAMNAVSGVISFPRDKLEVTSVVKNGSIINLWVQEPSFSNTVGTVAFEGIVLNPGFTGASGKIITINFKVKAAGQVALNFSSGSVLANDGQGTNILTGFGNATFLLGIAEPSAGESETPSVTAGVPAAPQISSPTHPDTNGWYARKDAKFSWPFYNNITGVRLLLGKIPQASPTISYAPAIGSKEFTDLADGVWYFHARLRNAAGWGGITHFRFQIDTQKPSRFDITEVERADKTEPKAKFALKAEDETSGIDFYEIRIDDSGPQIWKDDGAGIFETSILGAGKHIFIAKVVDKAGNYLANSAEFTIEPLESPVIADWSKELPSGERLVVKGTSKYPNAQVVVWFERQGEDAARQITRTDEQGNFLFASDEPLKDGIYNIWAELVDTRGARSGVTEKIIAIVKPPKFFTLGTKALGILSLVVPLSVLGLALLFILWYGWHRFSMFKKRLRKEIKEADRAARRAFDLLREDVKKQIKLLEKTKTRRELTEEEEKIIKQLQHDLDDAEKVLRKEIQDIEKEAG